MSITSSFTPHSLRTSLGSKMSLLSSHQTSGGQSTIQASYLLLSKIITKIVAQAVINYKFPSVGNF